MGTPLYSHARDASFASSREKLPNPEFSFPMKPADPDLTSSITSRPTPSRTRQQGAGSRRTASALPSFSFNPSSAGEMTEPVPAEHDSTSVSSSSIPSDPIPIAVPRNIGHRRGASEFIGGDGRTGGSGLMSTSPSKDAGSLSSSAGARLGPPPGRRGHAHRRSGAISCHDLQTILQPTTGNARPAGGSAPVTPLETENMAYFAAHSRRTASQTSIRVPSEPSSPPSEAADASPRKGFAKPRVGFSDQLEFIRPLSTISSETESSMSTIRGGHSVNGSLSSVLSAGTASPSSLRTGRPSLQTTLEEGFLSRPRTASDVLDSASVSKVEFSQALALPERPSTSTAAAPEPIPTALPLPVDESPTKAKPSKKRHFGWFEQKRQGRNHSRERSATLPSSKSEPSLLATPPDSPALPIPGPASYTDTPAFSSLAPDHDKKPRKSRSWAHPFMSLRHRQKPLMDDADDELSTAPASGVTTPGVTTPGEELDFAFMANFDADNTVDIVTEPQSQPMPVRYPSPLSTPTLGAVTPPMSDVTSPIIDLDAALAPFNSLQGSRPSQGRTMQRRSMHSSGGSGNTIFGMTQHRRTESAPALVPFETRSAKMPTSTMADVFEEEEEDEYSPKRVRRVDTAPETIPEVSSDEPGLGIQVVDSSTDHAPSEASSRLPTIEDFENTPTRANPGLGKPFTESAPHRFRHGSESPRGTSSIEVVQDFEEPRTQARDSDSTITPDATDDEAKKPCPPLQLTMPMGPPPMMTPDTLASSPMSALEFRRGSRPSFEIPRVGTAASSFTDSRTVSSFALGEPNPDFRCSVDDVPSLTSSRSTMTNTPHHPLSQAQSYADTRSIPVGSRPSAGMDRARKRGSIASLSRLISGESFAGRSKLSIESRPMSEHGNPDDQARGKKKNRMSRLMAFWKSKERSST